MYLAEINNSNICISIKQALGMIDDGNHVEIPSLDLDFLWRKYENGQWSTEEFKPPEPTEPQPSIEEQILAENQYQTMLLELTNLLGGM